MQFLFFFNEQMLSSSNKTAVNIESSIVYKLAVLVLTLAVAPPSSFSEAAGWCRIRMAISNLHQMHLRSVSALFQADRIQFESVCVFTLEADAARLQSVTALAIWSPLGKMRRASVFAGLRMHDASIQHKTGSRGQKKNKASGLISK